MSSFSLGSLFVLGLVLLLSGCAVGPNYRTPVTADVVASDWKWTPAEPRDNEPKGPWWHLYDDPELDQLQRHALKHNQDLRQALARLEASRAGSQQAFSRLIPDLDANPSFSRARTSANDPNAVVGIMGGEASSRTRSTFNFPLDLSYEIDVWGRVRRGLESARAEADSQAADLENAMLTVTAEVARLHFLLQTQQSEQAILDQAVEDRREAVEILEKRLAAGLANQLELEQQRTELNRALIEQTVLKRERNQTSNALAQLIGVPAPAFEIPGGMLTSEPPEIPVGLPSSLLERRPDIAGAERLVAARNAEIGVAYGAFFPVFRLTGQGGYLSAEASSLFRWESGFGSIGPSISIPIFAVQRNLAGVREARARYEESAAFYRQSILTAMREVEDALTATRTYRQQREHQEAARDSATRATNLARIQHQEGLIPYLTVIDTQRIELQESRAFAVVRGRQMIASIQLVKALGGVWN